MSEQAHVSEKKVHAREGKTFWIEFIGDRSVKIREGQSILQASLDAGIHHYHACGGNGECSTCRILVKEGASLLSDYSEKECSLREKIPLPEDVRLACQTFVKGSPVKIHRIIRDEVDVLMYTQETDAGNQSGEEKDLALLFLDIKSFTPFMESYLPFDVIHILRRLFYLFRKAIETHHGKIIETVGDGLYAVFGFEASLETAARDAVRAGEYVLDELAQFNESYVYKYFYHRFEVGMGLHVGRVITGNVGLGVNNSLTVMGLPVNIASRLQAATRKLNNSFIISDDVMRLLDKPPRVPTLQINLRGVRETFTVHLLGKPYGEENKEYILTNFTSETFEIGVKNKDLILHAYASFNERDIDSVLSVMHPEIIWPNAWEGGWVAGHEAVRNYWTRQWKELDPAVQPVSFKEKDDGRIAVGVHQVVKDLGGKILSEGMVRHVYTISGGLITKMEVENF